MKKIFTLIAALAAVCATAKALPGAAMTFVGKSNFYVVMGGNKTGETAVASDTVLYQGNDITIPSMNYNGMVIPSFTIAGTKFSGGYTGVVWEDQTFTSAVKDANGNDKAINGSSLKGTFTHDGGIYKLSLQLTFSYGSMPFPVTYEIESYYVKDYAGQNVVMVGGMFGPYTASVNYRLRTYVEDGVTKMDVQVPAYELSETAIGDLSLSSYTVKGLTYDDLRGGYYKDYAADSLSMHFKAVDGGKTSMDADYALAAEGAENILVQITGSKAKITNNFKPGRMPFAISAVMDQSANSGSTNNIELATDATDAADAPAYNLNGQRVDSNYRGIVIRNGKKYLVR